VIEVAMFGRLAAACVIVGIVLYLLQAVGRATVRTAATSRPGGRLVAVLETTALPNSASLHVVRVAERYYVLGRSPAQITMLCELPGASAAISLPPPVLATEREATMPFASFARWCARIREPRV